MKYISGIYRKRDPIKGQCNDGTFTTGNCNWHGGFKTCDLKELTVKKVVEKTKNPDGINWVRSVRLKDIHIARHLFQNRDTEFSEDSVKKIISAVKSGTFHIQVFDPILLWRDMSSGKLYILSGHSRYEAFSRLSEEGYKQFNSIPSRIIDVDQQTALNIARDSNNLGTMETDSERAKRYRELLAGGMSLKDVMVKARQLEGSNANRVVAYAFLNPSGKTFDFIKAMERGEIESAGNMKNIAYWIADARMKFYDLTNSHENELLDWLLKGAYTTLANKDRFIERVKIAMARNSFMGNFDNTKPLNIANQATRSQFDEDLENAMIELKDAQKSRDTKLKELTQRGATRDQIDRIMLQFNADVLRAQQEVSRIQANKGMYANAEKSQGVLFGIEKILKNQTVQNIIINYLV